MNGWANGRVGRGRDGHAGGCVGVGSPSPVNKPHRFRVAAHALRWREFKIGDQHREVDAHDRGGFELRWVALHVGEGRSTSPTKWRKSAPFVNIYWLMPISEAKCALVVEKA